MKKRNGITIERAVKLKSTYLLRLQDLFSAHIFYRSTHQTIIKAINESIFEQLKFKRAPRWLVEYLRGYRDARLDSIQREHVVWMNDVDGRLMTTKEVDQLTSSEAASGVALADNYKSPWQRACNGQGQFVWLDKATGLPMINKPYYGQAVAPVQETTTETKVINQQTN